MKINEWELLFRLWNDNKLNENIKALQNLSSVIKQEFDLDVLLQLMLYEQIERETTKKVK